MGKYSEQRANKKAERHAYQTSRPAPGSGKAPAITTVAQAPNVSVSFRYAEPGGKQCLSQCGSDHTKDVIDTLRILCSLTWTQVHGHKGLGWCEIPDHSISFTRPQEIDQQIKIAEIRCSQKGRIWGFNQRTVFHILWFDPDHDGTGR